MVKFYSFLRRAPPRANGHNRLAALAYLAVYGLFGLSILSGLGLFNAGTLIRLDGADLGRGMRRAHDGP